VAWSRTGDLLTLLAELRLQGYRLAALEQAERSISLPQYHASDKMALLVGREVEGIDPALLQQVDDILEIPMFGSKESFNVAQATAIALYQLRTAS
jgi:tRNA G18 (ribose-2'-O)-methylase SpoU